MLSIEYEKKEWPLKMPFKISRYTRHSFPSLLVTLKDEKANVGRGEALGIPYKGETPDSIASQLEAIRADMERGANLAAVQELLPPGGARNALDAALWDLNAKRSGVPAWQTAGLRNVRSVVTAETIGIRSLAGYRERAMALADCPAIKLKAGGEDDLAAIRTVREAAPRARLIIDANEAWTPESLRDYMPELVDLRVELIEQPLPSGADDALLRFESPIPLCADESIKTRACLPGLVGKYDVVSIKLDKTGGLTEALATSQSARKLGFDLMVGCMGGSSLAIAPAMIVAQDCQFADLDGPLLQAADHEHALRIDNHSIEYPSPELWG